MTRSRLPISLKARLGLAFVALAVFASAAGGGLVAIQSVHGIGLVEGIVARAFFRTITEKREERTDRKNINKRRDVEKAEVDQQQQMLDFQRDRRWLDQASFDREGARLEALTTGLDERAKRERQITSYQTRQSIRDEWAGAVEDVLTVSTGLNPKAVSFTGSLLRGEKPITAAIDAVLAGPKDVVDPRQQFLDLQQTLSEVEEGIRFVRDRAGILARVRLTRLLREMGGPDVTPEGAEEALAGLRQLGADVEEAVAQAGAIKEDLFPQSPGIDRARFAENEKWITLNDNVQALSESTAGRAVLAGLLRAGVERARELLEGTGITLTDEQLIAIAREAGSLYVDARVRDGRVTDAAVVDIDSIVRIAANQALATAGLDPLPTSTPVGTPVTVPTATPLITDQPMPTSTPAPEPEPTATPMAATFVTGAFGTGSAERDGAEYDFASVSLFIDPAVTNWIAWNNAPEVVVSRASRPGEVFLGPGGFGTDDLISLTVVSPDGGSLTVDLDRNDATGRWSGPQNVIFGSAAAAPDVFRQYPSFAPVPGPGDTFAGPNTEFFIDEAGSHNAIFTTAGTYEFRFSFRNTATKSAGHPDIYLLVDTR